MPACVHRCLSPLACALLALACGEPPPTAGASGAPGGTPSGGSGLATNAGGSGANPTSGGTTWTGGAGAWPSGGGTGGAGPSPTGGSVSSGGTATGGSAATGGIHPSGGATGGAGEPMTGGTGAGGAASTGATGGTTQKDCSVTVTSLMASPEMATVGVVEWSTSIPNPSGAEIVYSLTHADANVLNTGGIAPAELDGADHRTLLLGLKPASSYAVHVEVTGSDGTICESDETTLTTGTLSNAPTITREATRPDAQAGGFFILSGGVNHTGGPGSDQAFIVDADGDVVWTTEAPPQCGRARLDYEAKNLWMIAVNVGNNGGEMRYVSMDGVTKQNNVSGLGDSHHDFTVLPGGVVATMAWSEPGMDPESDLIERTPDGTVSTAFHIGPNLYQGGPGLMGGSPDGYHCNSVLYHPADDTYTIGDRNPSTFVKVSRTGSLVWQFGGDCSGAPAPACVPGSWSVNHGHQILDNGGFLFFSNGEYMESSPSTVLEFSLTTAGTVHANQVDSYTSPTGARSNSLGDVQRLANGNTMVVFSNDGLIEELDPSWNVVQTLSADSFGYADWRATLYGPPPR